MSTDKDTHTIQFCCGTTCDAEANLNYVKDLETLNAQLKVDLERAGRTIRLLMRRQHGPTEGDTTRAT